MAVHAMCAILPELLAILPERLRTQLGPRPLISSSLIVGLITQSTKEKLVMARLDFIATHQRTTLPLCMPIQNDSYECHLGSA